MANKRKKKTSTKRKESSPLIFLLVTFMSFGLMIGYVWLNNEVTRTMKAATKTNRDIKRLSASNKELKAEIAVLSRSDRITRLAREKLGMVIPPPQPITLAASFNPMNIKNLSREEQGN